MIMGIIGFLLAIAGIVGIYTDITVLVYVGAAFYVIETIIGLYTRQLKSPWTSIVSIIAGVIFAVSAQANIFYCICCALCWEALVLGAVGYIVLLFIPNSEKASYSKQISDNSVMPTSNYNQPETSISSKANVVWKYTIALSGEDHSLENIAKCDGLFHFLFGLFETPEATEDINAELAYIAQDSIGLTLSDSYPYYQCVDSITDKLKEQTKSFFTNEDPSSAFNPFSAVAMLYLDIVDGNHSDVSRLSTVSYHITYFLKDYTNLCPNCRSIIEDLKKL